MTKYEIIHKKLLDIIQFIENDKQLEFDLSLNYFVVKECLYILNNKLNNYTNMGFISVNYRVQKHLNNR